MIGIREIKRLTDERLIEVRRVAEGDGIGLIEGIEEKGSLRLSFDRDKKEERAHGNKILSTDIRRIPMGKDMKNSYLKEILRIICTGKW